MADDSGTLAASDVWSGDCFGRSREADLLKKYLVQRLDQRVAAGKPRTFVLNLDAPWGSGKSFFLKRLGQDLEQSGFLAKYVNAWEDDYSDDPMLPVLEAIQATFQPYLEDKQAITKKWQSAMRSAGLVFGSIVKHGGKALAKRFVGEAVDEIPEVLSAEPQKELEGAAGGALSELAEKLIDSSTDKLIKAFSETKSAADKFRTDLAEAISLLGKEDQNHRQIFVLIDELDRCRPTYAIEMLERLKHLFNTDGLVFILATDTDQLRHAIRAVYGEGFDSTRYLLRFFDRQYLLRPANFEQLLASVLGQGKHRDIWSLPPGAKSVEWFFSNVAQGFGLKARDVEQSAELLLDLTALWTEKCKIELAYMLPLIMFHQQGRSDLMGLTRGGEGASDLVARMPLMLDFSDFHYNSKSPVRLGQVFLEFASVKDMHYRQIHEKYREVSSEPGRWVSHRLGDELSATHSGGFSSHNPPRTVIGTYQERVKSIQPFS